MTIRELTLTGDVPCLVYGDGPPLLFVRTLMPRTGNPTGVARAAEARLMKPLARHHTIYSVGHRPGLGAGTTMTQLAQHLAEAIPFDDPVDVMGMSTGGSLALQLAADHPQRVRKLVPVATACRLGPLGKQVQLDYRILLAAARYRAAATTLAVGLSQAKATKAALKGVLWLTAPTPTDPGGMIAMLDAEDGFDLDCSKVRAPTLLIAGENDLLYPRDLAEQTAAGIPDARLLLYKSRGHVSVTRERTFYTDISDFLSR
jgi:pimeloyl-ACP methyl ester carboxylesterase